MEKIEELERNAIRMLLAGDDPILKLLRRQYENARVDQRNFTGKGFFTHLIIPSNTPRLNISRLIIDDVYGLINDNNHVGFIMFINDGALSCLEGYTYENEWPDQVINYELTYEEEKKQRNLKKLRTYWEETYGKAIIDDITRNANSCEK